MNGGERVAILDGGICGRYWLEGMKDVGFVRYRGDNSWVFIYYNGIIGIVVSCIKVNAKDRYTLKLLPYFLFFQTRLIYCGLFYIPHIKIIGSF